MILRYTTHSINNKQTNIPYITDIQQLHRFYCTPSRRDTFDKM
jgi:hypothetical protein